MFVPLKKPVFLTVQILSLMKSLHLLALMFCVVFATHVFGQAVPRSVPFFTVLKPFSIRAQYEYTPDLNTTPYSTAFFGADVGNDVISGLAAIPKIDSLACNLPTHDLSGKIALIQRGSCEFGQKALNVQKRGAIGVVIIDFDETLNAMSPGLKGDSVTIPVIMVPWSLGAKLLLSYYAGEQIELAFSKVPVGLSLVEGDVRRDDDNDCVADIGEQPLKGWYMHITDNQNQTASTLTDADGHYRFWLDTTHTSYDLRMVPASPIWAACPAVQVLNVSGPGKTQINFSAQALLDCATLEANIGTPLLRRCFSNVFTVNVCNQGTADATDAYADVTLASQFDPITDVSRPFTMLAPDVYRFELGTLGSGECVNFQFSSVPNCDSTVLAQTLCYSVHAHPDTICDPVLPQWSGANVSVIGTCNGNEVRFRIINDTKVGMASVREYVIIEDDVMREEGTFQLGPEEERIFTLPANGHTWRIEAQQEIYHPRSGVPSVALEACGATGSNFGKYFVTIFPIYDPSPAEDNECREVIGSFDPNDKQGFPVGVGPQHLIRENTDIEYLIRFQNTGTDTAFTVVVRDTLPAVLDASRIRFGASSHAYELEKTADNVLIFKFKNIRLVDKSTNEPLSHGYLKFRIAQQPNLPYGTQIHNSAAIYFDFNPPVITNTTEHEVGKVVGISLSKEPGREAAPQVTVSPNPATAATVLQLRGESIENAPWRLFDTAGRLRAEGRLDGVQLRLPHLPAGMLWLELRDESGRAFFVKIVVE